MANSQGGQGGGHGLDLEEHVGRVDPERFRFMLHDIKQNHSLDIAMLNAFGSDVQRFFGQEEVSERLARSHEFCQSMMMHMWAEVQTGGVDCITLCGYIATLATMMQHTIVHGSGLNSVAQSLSTAATEMANTSSMLRAYEAVLAVATPSAQKESKAIYEQQWRESILKMRRDVEAKAEASRVALAAIRDLQNPDGSQGSKGA